VELGLTPQYHTKKDYNTNKKMRKFTQSTKQSVQVAQNAYHGALALYKPPITNLPHKIQIHQENLAAIPKVFGKFSKKIGKQHKFVLTETVIFHILLRS
jgi:hypothetical protein